MTQFNNGIFDIYICQRAEKSVEIDFLKVFLSALKIFHFLTFREWISDARV